MISDNRAPTAKPMMPVGCQCLVSYMGVYLLERHCLSWLGRRLTGWTALHPGQQYLLGRLGLTAATNPLVPSRRTRRTFEQTVQLPELFLQRERGAPSVREESVVDGEHVRIGSWLAKTRTGHRAGRLPAVRAAQVASLFDGDWTDEAVGPAVLA